MRSKPLIFKFIFFAAVFLLLTFRISAQTVTEASAFPVNESGTVWEINVSFDQSLTLDQIEKAYILNEESEPPTLTTLRNLEILSVAGTVIGIRARTDSALETVLKQTPSGMKTVLKDYSLVIRVRQADGSVSRQTQPLNLLDANIAANRVVKKEAKNVDDADVYIAGEVNGAHKRKTTFSTEIKLQKLKAKDKWDYTPYGFFKLNTSTDPDADPDRMEFGFRFGRFFDKTIFTSSYWENEAKIESERDFENTNLLYSSRLIFTPAGVPSEKTSKQKFFFRPFIGTELGKNLRSPLPAAEGDGIARILAGAEARVVIFGNREKGQGIDWITSYTRRWLLTDELGFRTDDDGNLVLNHFGKSPRDFVESKVTFGFSKHFGAFIGYDWGQVPPSYKFVNHRFRVGFVYKYKFGIK